MLNLFSAGNSLTELFAHFYLLQPTYHFYNLQVNTALALNISANIFLTFVLYKIEYIMFIEDTLFMGPPMYHLALFTNIVEVPVCALTM